MADADFRLLLKRFRTRAGLTQKSLAAETGVTVQSVKNWESEGERAFPLDSTLPVLCRALCLSAGESAQLAGALEQSRSRSRHPKI